MGIYILVCLEPPKSVSNKLVKARKAVIKKTKQNLYGNHAPHISLYPNTFRNFYEVENVIKQTAKKYRQFMVEIDGISTLENPSTQNVGVVYKIKPNHVLRKLQREIMNKLRPLMTEEAQKWLLDSKDAAYSKRHMQNIKKYGYPFGPEEWVFHSSIAEVRENQKNIILRKLSRYNVREKWKVKEISVFIYLGEIDGVQPFRSYKLRA